MMFKCAVIQFAPRLGDIEFNISFVQKQMDKLADAALVVLPELASTGYNFENSQMATGLAERPSESRYIEMLHAMAVKNNQFIVSGFSEKDGNDIYNSSILIGPQGPLGIYRKMHLFMHEKEFFKPGEGGLTVYDTGFCKLGMQICFDYLFPEPWRILAQKGAELICHPSNLLTQNAVKALPGVALMNKIFILTANRIGTEGALTFNGGSMLIDPKGDIPDKASADKEEVLMIDIDPLQALDKMITPLNHVFDDRRPEQYSCDNC
jgi:predicted amidohydrolase